MKKMSNKAFIKSFKERPCVLPDFHIDYVEPSAQDLKDVIEQFDLLQVTIGLITGDNLSGVNGKHCTSVSRWVNPQRKDSRKIPYAKWRSVLIYVGIVTRNQMVQEIDDYLKNVN